ncbi:hypothetical protein BD769DRAFT_1679641 [Suillus cothurnatus]|nr:hypothetical protein BD769DRAFT_1679641 [Suillus cothurnatus]
MHDNALPHEAHVTSSFEALNPNVKIAYAEHQWDKVSFNVGLDRLRQVFDEYYVAPISVAVEADNEQGTSDLHGQYGHSWVLAAVQAHLTSDCTQLNPRAELTTYLGSPLKQTDDIVAPPVAVPDSFAHGQGLLAYTRPPTPSEHAFSSSGLMGTKRWNHLKTDDFESLQLLKSVYHNGHISATSDAEQHLDALIAALHDGADKDSE